MGVLPVYLRTQYLENMECKHIDITDEGICKSCGIDFASQEFVDSLPEAPESLDYLGDLMGIIKLAEATAKEYATKYTKAKPKFRWIGVQLVRTSDWTEVLESSFVTAKKLGYRGDIERWGDICKGYASSLI
jgi:hypothetical protein